MFFMSSKYIMVLDGVYYQVKNNGIIGKENAR